MNTRVKLRLGLLSVVIFTFGILNFILKPSDQGTPATVNAQNTPNNGIFTARVLQIGSVSNTAEFFYVLGIVIFSIITIAGISFNSYTLYQRFRKTFIAIPFDDHPLNQDDSTSFNNE